MSNTQTHQSVMPAEVSRCSGLYISVALFPGEASMAPREICSLGFNYLPGLCAQAGK